MSMKVKKEDLEFKLCEECKFYHDHPTCNACIHNSAALKMLPKIVKAKVRAHHDQILNGLLEIFPSWIDSVERASGVMPDDPGVAADQTLKYAKEKMVRLLESLKPKK